LATAAQDHVGQRIEMYVVKGLKANVELKALRRWLCSCCPLIFGSDDDDDDDDDDDG
jgi:hypothetical protein